MIIPRSFTAGLTLSLPITLTAYPAPDWSLKLLLRGPDQITLTAIPDINQHCIAVDAELTKAWSPGVYWYSLRAEKEGQVYEVEEGQTEILTDLEQVADLFDNRNHAEKVLAAIEAVIEGRASMDQQRYKINDRELERTPISELLRLRSTYKSEVRRIQASKSGQSLLGRQVKVRF